MSLSVANDKKNSTQIDLRKKKRKDQEEYSAFKCGGSRGSKYALLHLLILLLSEVASFSGRLSP